MTFIPSTFDERQINRTVIGGNRKVGDDALNISVILLNSSGSQFKLQLFENLLTCKFAQIVSVEHDANNFALDDLSKKFPSIKFIIPLEKATDGEFINLAMSEVTTDYVLVLRDNLTIPSGIILNNLAEKLVESGVYCVVPRLMDNHRNGITEQLSPGVVKNHFVIDSLVSVSDGVKTVYPYDFIGLYNRKKFIQLGGFDYTIKSPYWQNLDLAMRSWLWGEETHLTTILQFAYATEPTIEDKTLDKDYLRFHLKNELPKFKNDRGIIKKRQFFSFFLHSRCGYLEARRLFKAARIWVNANKYRFKTDLLELIKNWSAH